MTKKDMTTRHDQKLGMLNKSYHFTDLFSMMHQLMDLAWNDWDLRGDAFYALQPKTTLPKINIAETDDNYEVEIATSGINKDNIELEFKDSCLFIKADKSEEAEVEDKKWLKREISSRSFRRTIKFPVKIDGTGITSTYNEAKGLIMCTLPKIINETPEVLKIKIN